MESRRLVRAAFSGANRDTRAARPYHQRFMKRGRCSTSSARLRLFNPVLLLLLVVLMAILDGRAQNLPPTNRRASYRADRILIQPMKVDGSTALEVLHRRHGTRILRVFPSLENLQVLSLPAGGDVNSTVAAFRQSGLVEFAEPDYWLKAAAVPNDPRFLDGTLWGVNNTGQRAGRIDADIDAPEGWDIRSSASNVVVAIIDSGIRTTHEDLAANLWVNPGEIAGNGLDDDRNGIIDDVHGIDSITNKGDPKDDSGHGTHVAGIIGAVGNNGKGVTGIAWNVQLMILRFMDSSGYGATSDAIQCIDYARSKGASIINASWGGTDNSAALRGAISRARDAGIIFVGAAGNESANNDVVPNYPASFEFDNIVSVGASTRTDGLADFSDFGATTVDLFAPGDTIYSTWFTANTAYSYLSGTSMAAPYVTGALALLRAQFPGQTYRQLIDRLLAATDPVANLAGKCVSGGRLNLDRALRSSLLANFAASPLVGSPPLTVSFKDLSFGESVQKTWSFGDGSPTTAEPNPSHVYRSEGNFNVSLTLSGPNGVTSVRTQVVTVIANYQIQNIDFNWIDPTAMTRLVLTDNGISPAQRLPFPFVFYGQSREQIFVAANGVIGFGSQGLETTSNTDLPSSGNPNGIICPYWDNLNPASGGSVRIGTLGEAPRRRVVVSWVNVPRSSTTGTPLSFQAVLEETSHRIQFQYLEVQPNSTRGAARGATVGLENESGAIAAKYTFDGSPSLLKNSQALLFVPQSRGGLVVSPSTGLAAAGTAGGPFSPASLTYTLENTGDQPLRWLMGKTEDWVQLGATNGVLNPGESTSVAISLTDSAHLLKAGSYSDTLAFINADTGYGNTARTVSLVVNGSTGLLVIAPDSGLSASGSSGGPFNPDTQVYTLINTGDATLLWNVTKTQPWIGLSSSSGSLAPGASTTLTVSILSEAETLPIGLHEDVVQFVNTSNSLGNDSRNVILRIRDVPPAQLSLDATVESGRLRLRITGQPGKVYRIETSSDLRNWATLFTNTILPDGFFDVTELANGASEPKFYRAVLVP